MASGGHVASYYTESAQELVARPALDGDRRADVGIVGGGFTGLSAALELANRGYSVILLDAAGLASGASGRNGGQIIGGFANSMTEVVRVVGLDEARRLFALSREAAALVRERVARHAIGCDLKPGYYHAAVKPRHLDEMSEEHALLEGQFGGTGLRMLDRDGFRAVVTSPRFVGAMHDSTAGHLHPLNYALGLARAAEAAGALLFERSAVTRIEADGGPARLVTAHGTVTADHLVLAANVYAGALDRRFRHRVLPAWSQIAATEPLPEAVARMLIADDACICDSNILLDYWRLSADRRLLYGGRGTLSGRPPSDPVGLMRRRMLATYPQLRDVRIERVWGGDVAITANLLPDIGRLGPNVFYAHGFCGHGVALAGFAGKLMAEAVAGTAERFALFERLPGAEFPVSGAPLRALRMLALVFYRIRDAF
ncbi:NAD(P)/FAD-dependent oxidoreductase [Oceanibacterium hippocampi]|uniref:Gamma-glutamylputrescine oxidoreductase n=1 Tax=Oceanibacterium hippocampi TaxID=745714 RepID=A0A1Y5SN01_9PROT|nr:FAD-binding oxidoreductase [Oceanibacterium hippocampi]SLN44425.1 Gamma-glutamylputrescine oxidoreductase [Oceanibacterium hippocampi]